MPNYKITSQEFGRGPVSKQRFAVLADAAAYIAARWQGDEYRDSAASFHTDYCTYVCHGFTLDQVRPRKMECRKLSAAQFARRCTSDDCDAGAHCRTCGGHFLDYNNSGLRGQECQSCQYDGGPKVHCVTPGCGAGGKVCQECYFDHDEDGPGVNGPAPVFQAGLDDGECGFDNGVHWSDPAADFPRY